MLPDVCGLVGRDHDDLDRAIEAMVDPRTTADELVTLLDVLKLALAVHITAESKMFETLFGIIREPRPVRLIGEQVNEEHASQQASVDALALVTPATPEWYERALDLRVLLFEHATRAELMRFTLLDEVPLPQHRALAHDYATERMRMLGKTSPIALAREQLRRAAGGS
jgi:hypothetical protein